MHKIDGLTAEKTKFDASPEYAAVKELRGSQAGDRTFALVGASATAVNASRP
jgi:hypothetical protein